jgi:FMN phosphatase YigB (HAD superfamily)
MTERGVVLLDFDGVICDSVDECMAASARGYYDLQGKTMPAALAAGRRADFGRLRPFIRTGEDYLLIHELIDRGVVVRDQAGFDEMARRAGPEKMGRFRELFYRGRVELQRMDRDAWMTMNRIYPEARRTLEQSVERPLFILSTKRPEFIQDILAHAGVRVPQDRILFSGHDRKLPIAERIRGEGGFARAVFVDDQVDHLVDNPFPLVSVYLASWGYVASERVALDAGIPVLAAEDLPGLAARTLDDGAFHGGGSSIQ